MPGAATASASEEGYSRNALGFPALHNQYSLSCNKDKGQSLSHAALDYALGPAGAASLTPLAPGGVI